jgi:tetratricopeptide (TPR) repeat protein
MSKENYIAEIIKEFPSLKAGKENDENWANEGFEFLSNKNYEQAEIKFKMLTRSQPKHQDGFEGLAYLYYETGDYKKAVWFMKKAVKIAREFLKNNSIDLEVIEEMESNLKSMETKKTIKRWWE